ncbi:MmgE/PrpD family protein [Xanthobacter sediminis]
MTGPTRALGRYLSEFPGATLPPGVEERALKCLLDAMGLVAAARGEPTARAALRLAQPAERGPRSWISGTPLAPTEAAFANGVAQHAHFQDDTDHDSWAHPGSLIVPAVSALGELRGLTLAAVLRGLVAGYTVINWLGRNEEVARRLIQRGFRTSPSFGTIGAAAAAAVLLRLPPAQAASAVAIAAGSTGGTLEPVRAGSDEWRVQNGRAAQGGLIAGLLAEGGVEGAPEALEGARGFLFALAGLSAPPDCWATPPDAGIMLRIMAKPFATLGDNMPAAIAAEALHRQGITAGDIARIEVTIWRPYTEYPGTSFKGPYVRQVQTQASTAFAVSAMLCHGDLTYEMGLDLRDDPRINALVQRTAILPHDRESALWARVELLMKDGRRLASEAEASTSPLVFQPQARALEVFTGRMARAGAAAERAAAFATGLFAAQAEGRDPPFADVVRAYLDLAPLPAGA